MTRVKDHYNHNEGAMTMSIVDESKPVWRVEGRLPAPDGRRMICFVNAENDKEAAVAGEAAALYRVEAAWEINIQTGLRLRERCKATTERGGNLGGPAHCRMSEGHIGAHRDGTGDDFVAWGTRW